MGLISINVRLHKNAEPVEVQAALGESNDGGYAIFATPDGEHDKEAYPFRSARPNVQVVCPRGSASPYTEVYWVLNGALTRSDVAGVANKAYTDQKWGLSADTMELLHNNPEPLPPLTREELVHLLAEANAVMTTPIVRDMACSMNCSVDELSRQLEQVEEEWELIKEGIANNEV